jgi:hypothetical protein
MAHISIPDPERPFGITERTADIVLHLHNNGYKWKTPKAVETAIKTKIFANLQRYYWEARLASGMYVFELQ